MKNTPTEKLNEIYQEAEKLRMTNWEDLNGTQQIERMREIVQNLQNSVMSIRGTLESIDNGFEKHSHSNGKIVIDYNKYRGRGQGAITDARQAKNYF